MSFLISNETNAKEESQVFVPGPNDLVAGSSAMLPRAKLVQQIVQPLVDRLGVKNAGENPQ